VGVIINPTVSEFPKISFSINPAVFLTSGLALKKLRHIAQQKAVEFLANLS